MNRYAAVLRRCAILNACAVATVCAMPCPFNVPQAEAKTAADTAGYEAISLDNTDQYRVDYWSHDDRLDHDSAAFPYKDDYYYKDKTVVWYSQNGHAGRGLNFFDDVVMEGNANLVFDFNNSKDGPFTSTGYSSVVAAIKLGLLDSRDTTDDHITWDVDYSDTLSITGGSIWVMSEYSSTGGYATYGVYINGNTDNSKYDHLIGEDGLNYYAEINDCNLYMMNVYRGMYINNGDLDIKNTKDDGSAKDIYISSAATGIYTLNGANLSIDAGDVYLTGGTYGVLSFTGSSLSLNATNFFIEDTTHGMWLVSTASADIDSDTVAIKNTKNGILLSTGASLDIDANALVMEDITGIAFYFADNAFANIQSDAISISNAHTGIYALTENSANKAAMAEITAEYMQVKDTVYGVVASHDAEISIDSDTVIFTANRHAVHASGEANVSVKSDSFVLDDTAEGKEADEYALSNYGTGSVAVDTNSLAIQGASADSFIVVARCDTAAAEGESVQITAKSGTMLGSVGAAGSSSISLDFSGAEGTSSRNGVANPEALPIPSALTWTGAAYAQDDATIDVLLGSGAHWDVSDSSNITTLTLDSDAMVTLNSVSFYDGDNAGGNVDTARTSNGAGTILSVDELRGQGGTFVFHTHLAGDTDQVLIENMATEGPTHIFVHSVEDIHDPNHMAMDDFLVQTHEGYTATDFTLHPLQADGVDAGMYHYSLDSRDGVSDDGTPTLEWYLVRDTDANKTPSAELVLGLSGMAGPYASWYSRMSDLRERLGEVRHGQDNDGVWARAFAEENTLSGFTGTDFEQKVYGTSIGYDRLLEKRGVNENQWLLGVRGQITYADQEVDGRFESTGQSQSAGLAAYATWFNKNGWYADTVLTFDWFQQEMDTFKEDGTHINAEYDTIAGGISQELGRKFVFDNLMFIEPQLQLSYYVNKGADYTASNGIRVDVATGESLTGRAGLVFGKRWDTSEESYLQPYIKAGVTHEFLGEQKSTINGEHFYGDLGGTRIYYGAGLDWQYNQQFRFYGEFEREDGDEVSKPWSFSVGLRYSF